MLLSPKPCLSLLNRQNMKAETILMYGCMMTAVCLISYYAQAQAMQAVKSVYTTSKVTVQRLSVIN